MKKIFLTSIFAFGLIVLSGCSKSTWQGAYYNGGTNDSDIVYGPIFTNYEGCKSWAIGNASDAYNNYAYCAKNCHDSVAGTPICEEVVRTWQPLPGSNTFDNYKK
ncbi:MAG: hypothetical protein PHR61_01995 [Candidatus Absconditabacteria bacterium]|nr:hypothetical protein [Candidatus Absconditabacteria bacterium]